MQISVQSAQKTSLRRPVARTARTKAASSQALVLVRSTVGSSLSSSPSGETVGLPRPDLTLTVECTNRKAEQARELHRRNDILDEQLAIHGPHRAHLGRLVVDHEQP